MNERLRWRRQFLLTRYPIEFLGGWKNLKVGSHWLHVHPDLEVNHFSGPGKNLWLIGYLFDPVHAEKGNAQILTDIGTHSRGFEQFILQLKYYAGCYAFIYRDDQRFVLLQDPLSLREVYYCTRKNLIVCGSQPNLIAEFAEPAIKTTGDSEIRNFYRKDFKNSKWIGDDTYYENIKHLLPNHYLDLEQLGVRRYWPTDRIKALDLDSAVEQSCKFLQGIMRAAAQRHPLMIAVTAGTDSRTMLAASKHTANNTYFFINKERNLTDQSPDIRIPRTMLAKLGLPFHVHDVPRNVDPGFKQIFLKNTFFASERILPTIYHVYFKNHNDKLNVLGIGEIGRTRYGKAPKVLSAYRMAYALGYKDSDYVIKVCARLLPEMSTVATRSGVNVMTLLYWEQMMGNWGTVGNSESDIAVEEFDPYNSHFLYETLLGVEDKYTRYYNNVLFKEMIKRMWPELLEWPINPPADTLRERTTYRLKRMHMFGTLKRLKYQMHHFHYRFSMR